MFVPNGPTGIFGRVTNNRKQIKKIKREKQVEKAEKTKDSPFAVALKM